MGDLLYGEVDASDADQALPLRVYAPVGAHKDLLPYLVRRLLENGANSSFVNQFLDNDTPVSEIVRDPVADLGGKSVFRHPEIALPKDIFRASGRDGAERDNSAGLDLDNPLVLEKITSAGISYDSIATVSGIVNGEQRIDAGSHQVVDIFSPAQTDRVVAHCVESNQSDIDDALKGAKEAQPAWNDLGGSGRAVILSAVGDLLEQNTVRFMHLIGHEAGRIMIDTISEVREAADFCRYYGLKAKQHFGEPIQLPSPTGEQDLLSLHGRGTFLCISPWNFPLAIFVGQISAALAAGNSVIAKPAEQTPMVAYEAIKLFHQAGVPASVLQLLLGEGSAIGPALINDQTINGVAFTGSTQVAKLINRQLAERDGPIVPLIAETGGQNAMIVDSSALAEQVVDDAINSAFNSAGQRCSALRVLYLQEEVADDTIEMLEGAMDALVLGDPLNLATDIGPVIDEEARKGLQAHVDAVAQTEGAKIIARFDSTRVPGEGTFMAPTLIEIDSIDVLKKEVFGPVLHVIRYAAKDLDKVLSQINDTGFGLTLGVHSRREEFADLIYEKTNVGNTYINRNIVGAVVGVQPFGGHGLSGTGPKAGGPHYLFRFATEKTKSTKLVATGGDVSLLNLD
jgi:RHH-type proline utilization regulon transcriptional repressor/proline dehydrogenase/delta 1-pyrroline-5-carboxylate dehydrogenase